MNYRLTVYVNGARLGVDDSWKQENFEARKMLDAIPGVQCTL